MNWALLWPLLTELPVPKGETETFREQAACCPEVIPLPPPYSGQYFHPLTGGLNQQEPYKCKPGDSVLISLRWTWNRTSLIWGRGGRKQSSHHCVKQLRECSNDYWAVAAEEKTQTVLDVFSVASKTQSSSSALLQRFICQEKKLKVPGKAEKCKCRAK